MADRTRVLLGLAGTVDYEIEWQHSIIESLAESQAITERDITRQVPFVDDERSLLVALLATMRHGAGAEVPVTDPAVIESFAARFSVRVSLGGTNVRAATLLAQLGIESTVHLVSIDEHVRHLLPAGVDSICSDETDTGTPHLVIQYPADAMVRTSTLDVRSSSANRVIYAHDPAHARLLLHPGLGDHLAESRVFMISGLNVVADPELLQDRVRALVESAGRMPTSSLVFYEDAGFHTPQLRRLVHEALRDTIDVYSLNEDEAASYLGYSIELDDGAAVAAAVADLHRLLRMRTIVLHTSRWSLASGEIEGWLAAALLWGNAAAGSRYAHGDHIDRDQVAGMVAGALSAEYEMARAVARHSDGDIVMMPAFGSHPKRPTTIGLGDTFVGGFLAGYLKSTEPA